MGWLVYHRASPLAFCLNNLKISPEPIDTYWVDTGTVTANFLAQEHSKMMMMLKGLRVEKNAANYSIVIIRWKVLFTPASLNNWDPL